jgi:hypothetical protein
MPLLNYIRRKQVKYLEVTIKNPKAGYGIGEDTIWGEKTIKDTAKARRDIEHYKAKGVKVSFREIDTLKLEARITAVSDGDNDRCIHIYPQFNKRCKEKAIEGSQYCEKHTQEAKE